MAKIPKYFYFRLHPNSKGTKVVIEDASDVDVVEVVRCKDCTYYDPSETDCDWCSAWCGYTSPDTYCSYGERTEDKHDNNTRKV